MPTAVVLRRATPATTRARARAPVERASSSSRVQVAWPAEGARVWALARNALRGASCESLWRTLSVAQAWLRLCRATAFLSEGAGPRLRHASDALFAIVMAFTAEISTDHAEGQATQDVSNAGLSPSPSPSREPPVRLMPARMAARGALARLGLLAAEAGQWRGLSWSRGFPVPGPRGLASCLTEARDKGALFGVRRRQRRDRVAAAGVGAERVSSHYFLASWGQAFLSHSTVAREGGPLRLWSRRGARGERRT